jgi:hypothetical protein
MDNKNNISPTPQADPSQKTSREEIPAKASSYDELAERLRDTKGVDQDIGMLLALNWQRVLWGLAIVLLVVWLVGFWKESKEKAAGQASQRFEEVQTAYTALVSKQTKESESEKKADEVKGGNENGAAAKQQDQSRDEQVTRTFMENISLLRKQEGVYGELVPLYQAAEEIQRGNWEEAKQQLSQYGSEKYLERLDKKVSRPLTEEPFVSELAALIYLRLLIAEGITDPAVIRAKLNTLVSAGKFVNVEALIMLFRISAGPQERLEAENSAKELASSRPDLAEMLKVELGNQGIGIR